METRSAIGTGRREAAPRAPGLLVALEAEAPLDVWRERLRVRVVVQRAQAPLRLYLYLDGDLLDATVQDAASYEFRAASVTDGRHALTARVVDATGRWGGASEVVECRPR